MRNFRLATLSLFILFLTSCGMTQDVVWGNKYYDESFKDFFIDQKNNKIVLVGENNSAYNGNKNYNYTIDRNDDLRKIFELGIKSNIDIDFGYVEVRGSRVVFRSMLIRLNKNNLSKEELNFLYKNHFEDAKVGNIVWFKSGSITAIRQIVSREISENYKLISFKSKNNKKMWEENTPPQIAGKILLTPFAVALDILLAPIYFIGILGAGIGGH